MVLTPRRIQLLLLNLLPALIVLALLVFSLASNQIISGLNHFPPLLAMIPVFYWGMSRAREMPYGFVFLLGLINDAVSGQPLGISSLLYLAFLAMIRTQRKYIHKEGFIVQWCYFASLLGAMCALNWLLLSLFYAHAASLMPPLLQWGLTICCYPILHKLFNWLYEFSNSRRWHILQGS